MKERTALKKLLDAFVAIGIFLYGISPIIVALAWFVGGIFLSIHHSAWWATSFVLFIALIVAFGEDLIEFVEDKVEDASDYARGLRY